MRAQHLGHPLPLKIWEQKPPMFDAFRRVHNLALTPTANIFGTKQSSENRRQKSVGNYRPKSLLLCPKISRTSFENSLKSERSFYTHPQYSAPLPVYCSNVARHSIGFVCSSDAKRQKDWLGNVITSGDLEWQCIISSDNFITPHWLINDYACELTYQHRLTSWPREKRPGLKLEPTLRRSDCSMTKNTKTESYERTWSRILEKEILTVNFRNSWIERWVWEHKTETDEDKRSVDCECMLRYLSNKSSHYSLRL